MANPRRDEFQFPGFVGTSWTPWPDPDTGPMLAAVHLGELDGRIECVGVELWTVPPPARRDRQLFSPPGDNPLRAEDVRIPLGRMVEEAIGRHVGLAEVVVKTETFSPRANAGAKQMLAGAEGRSRKGGRPALYDRDHFAEVAKVYAAAWAAGRAGKPRQAVMNHWGVSADTASKWIAKCRVLELLGPTERGKAGGVKVPAKRETRKR